MAWYRSEKHNQAMAHPIRMRMVGEEQYIVEWYINRFGGYEWFHARGCFLGNEPKYAFFKADTIESSDTESTMREAARKFIMAWQYVWAEKAAEAMPDDSTTVSYYDDVEAIQEAFDL